MHLRLPFTAARRLALLALVLSCTTLSAHESRPGFLSVIEQIDDTYSIEFHQPVDKETSALLDLQTNCRRIDERLSKRTESTLIQSWTVHCDLPLTPTIIGFAASNLEVMVDITQSDGVFERSIISARYPSMTLSGKQTPRLPVYLLLGIDHLLGGADHVLFVIGLLLLIDNRWRLIQTVSSFTLAHSLTLALSTLGLIKVPQAPIEAAIALSILYVAVEITRQDRTNTLTTRAPLGIAFVFGLLHGFGFAGVLQDIGLPSVDAATALLLFNVGIELGQLAVICLALAVALCMTWVSRRLPGGMIVPEGISRRVAAYGIGATAVFWTLQRIDAIVIL